MYYGDGVGDSDYIGDDGDDGNDGEEEVNGHWPLARAASQQSDDGGSRHCDQGLVMRTGFGCSTLTMHGDENHDCGTLMLRIRIVQATKHN